VLDVSPMQSEQGLRPPGEGRPVRRRWIAKVAVVAFVAGLLVLANASGLFRQLSEPTKLAHAIAGLGGWGYAAFVIAYALIQPFGVPGTLFVMAAPLVWPWPVAFALSMVGTMAASVIGFVVARFVARDWLAPRIPASFRKYEERLAAHGFATVFVLRLIFWMPPLLHAFFGVSPVRFWTHFWGSLAGYVIPLLAVSYFGPRVFSALSVVPLWAWIAAGCVLVLLVVGIVVRQRLRSTRTSRIRA
jgi:uncharacterized membrane protein YdjX (TVP38/TMEM64 family)